VTKASVADLACLEFSPITFDRLHDTAATIKQVKAYDDGWTKLCGAGK
jgi:hypothetical protein